MNRPIDDERRSERVIAENLSAALKAGEFVLYSQAIKPIPPDGGKKLYQEILVRYAEEEDKLLPPGGFFPTLERLKLMVMLDKWVIARIIRWCAEQKKSAGKLPTAQYTINLSLDAVVDKEFPAFIADQLKKSHVPGDRLLFEISEQDVDQHPLDLDRLILALRPLGCGFVITGYGGEIVSAEMLQALGVNLVKIDGRIVRRVHDDKESFATAQAIHAACKEIGVRTIAELVEMRDTLQKLSEIGIDYAQGYGIATPAKLK
jgi:EAL domain-containing protein (putative c-di-GMP-specific phosphodiesterase class I)